MLPDYLPRWVDSEIAERLERIGAVVIEGPKACGKTRTARQASASEIRCDAVPGIATLVNDAPGYILDGPTPRLIDEWQTVPRIWNHVRHAVDDRSAVGQFILTGSASPADDESRHSGAGRFSRLRMRTLTLSEQCLSDRRVSLRALMEGRTCDSSSGNLSFGDLLEVVCAGGWPGNIALPLATALRNNIDYVEETTRLDISRIDRTLKGRDLHRIRAVIRSLSRSLGGSIGPSTIQADVTADRVPITTDTVSEYLDALHRVFLLESIYCWPTHLRSKAVLRTKPKVYFVDPSIAVAALNGNPDIIIKDLPLLGQIFENLVIRDLLVYAQHLDH
ncbi:MAG: ATP-binding protein, partial [Ignavibacteriae bacterium]